MRCLAYVFVLSILALPAWAQISLSIGQSRALPGQPIDIACSLQEREDYKPTSIKAVPYLITRSGKRRERGGIRGSDVYASAGGYLSYRRSEILAGDCGGAHAPLVPGRYEYDVTMRVQGKPDEKPFSLSITVDPLPPEPDMLTFNRITTDKWYGWRMAEYTLQIQEGRCYPVSLNPLLTHLIVFDASTGRVISNLTPGSHSEYPGGNKGTIDQYNCIPAGTIVDAIRAPDPSDPGDWHIALVVKKASRKLCDTSCTRGGTLVVKNLNVIAVTPLENTPQEPLGNLYFERRTERGNRPSAEASIGDIVRVVMEKPKETTERQVTITAGKQTKTVDLVPDGHLLASEWFTLGLPGDE
ncbi:MAG: hypothetical protein AAF221_04520 [Pseudomonadota bacterium]